MKTNRPSHTLILQLATVVGVVVLFGAWWKQQSELSRMRQNYAQIEEQNKGLQRDLTQLRVASVAAQPQAPEMASVTDPLQDSAAIHPAPPPPVPERNHLVLTGSEVSVVSNGLVTTLQFQPDKTGLLGVLALVIRLPKDGTAKILDLVPVGATTYSNVSKNVSQDGTFGIFQGTLGEATNVQFALSVSEPATADIRGTCGIKAFQLEIKPSGTKTRPLE